MAKRIFTTGGSTMVWTAQTTAAAIATLSFMELKGGSSTQVVDILEVQINGMASASAPAGFMLAYASTDVGTPTTLASPGSDGPMMINSTALVSGSTVLPYIAWTGTGPQAASSATLPKLNLGLNVFAGIIRWSAAPEQQWTSVGNATNAGISLLWNSSTHGGSGSPAANAHIIYEPY